MAKAKKSTSGKMLRSTNGKACTTCCPNDPPGGWSAVWCYVCGRHLSPTPNSSPVNHGNIPGDLTGRQYVGIQCTNPGVQTNVRIDFRGFPTVNYYGYPFPLDGEYQLVNASETEIVIASEWDLWSGVTFTGNELMSEGQLLPNFLTVQMSGLQDCSQCDRVYTFSSVHLYDSQNWGIPFVIGNPTASRGTYHYQCGFSHIGYRSQEDASGPLPFATSHMNVLECADADLVEISLDRYTISVAFQYFYSGGFKGKYRFTASVGHSFSPQSGGMSSVIFTHDSGYVDLVGEDWCLDRFFGGGLANQKACVPWSSSQEFAPLQNPLTGGAMDLYAGQWSLP